MKAFKTSPVTVTTNPPTAPSCLTVRNDAGAPAAEIIVDGVIGDGFFSDTTVTSDALRRALDAIPKGRKLNVRINSQGGSIPDGLGMYNALAERRADVTCHVTGYAASIASVLMLAGSRCVIPDAAVVMIHEAWVMAQGNADQMEKCAEMLRVNDDVIAGIYAAKTGKPTAQWRAKMKAETWYTGKQACEAGLGDECTDDDVSENLKRLDIKALRPPQTVLNMISGTAGIPQTPKGQTMETPTATPAAPPAAPVINAAEVENLRAQVKALREARIADRINKALAQCLITADTVDKFTALAYKDESILDVIEKLPAPQASKPAGPSGIQVLGTRLEQIRAMRTPQERFATLRNEYDDLRRACPRNDNSYSATLTTSFLTDGVVTTLQNRLAPLKAFMREFGLDPYKPKATHVVRNATAAATAQQDATSFESGDSTVGVISVTMHHESLSFHVTDGELQSGMRLADIIYINTAKFADTLIGRATTPITVANFTGDTVTSAADAFGWSDMVKLRGLLKKSPIKNAILDGEYFSQLTNVPSYFQRVPTEAGAGWSTFGFDGVYESTNWDSAGTNVRGFVCNPQALVLVAGLPVQPPSVPGNVLAIGSAQVPGLELSVATYQWFSLATRTFWMSFDSMFGCAKGDATAGFIIKSA